MWPTRVRTLRRTHTGAAHRQNHRACDTCCNALGTAGGTTIARTCSAANELREASLAVAISAHCDLVRARQALRYMSESSAHTEAGTSRANAAAKGQEDGAAGDSCGKQPPDMMQKA